MNQNTKDITTTQYKLVTVCSKNDKKSD